MDNIKISTAQFENISGDKIYNLGVIEKLAAKAAAEGSAAVTFHECSITGIYVVFSNPIGMDHDQLKNGCSMILDPFGDIISECRSLEDEIVTAIIAPEKLTEAGGCRYTNARRPELYKEIIGKEHTSEQKVAWMEPNNKLI